MGEIFRELRRRNIFRVAAAYVVLGWMILQVTGLVVPGFDMPDWTFPFVSFVLIIGFPLVLIFAWAFELTPDGLKRTTEVDPKHSLASHTGRKLDFIIIGVLSLALLLLVIDRLFLPPAVETISPPGTAASSIAVLPFVNMSSDPEQVYFSDGISEEILNVLSQIPGLHVTSRSSAFQFRGDDIHIPTVAQQLGVANILEGSVRKSGTRIRITAQLIDASTDRHLWSQTYDRELTDVFAIQDEISEAIVIALHVHLGLETPSLPAVRETDAEAYRLYLLGRHNFEQRTKETLYKAIDLFDQAIAIDQDYARAYSGMADAYMLLDGYGDLSSSEATAFAEPLIERALQLDPGLAEAHTSKGLLLQRKQQIEASQQSFDRAIELNPNLARAWHWRAITLEKSLDYRGVWECWQRAHALDPLSQQIFTFLIFNTVLFGQFSEAEELLAQRRATAPGDSDGLNGIASWVQAWKGNWSLQYTLSNEAFEGGSDSLNSMALAASLGFLRADEFKTRRFSESGRVSATSFANPALAWQDYQTLSEARKDDIALIETMARVGIRLGKYQEVMDLLHRLPGYTESFPGPLFNSLFAYRSTAPVLALAKQKTGDEAGGRRLVSAIERHIHILKEQSATWTVPFLEAEVHALKGEDDGVIVALRQAHIEGYLTWVHLEEPFFDGVRNREDFQAIVRSVDAKINEERAKLGWEPVE